VTIWEPRVPQPESVSLNDVVYVLKQMESTYTDNGNILNMVLEARGLSIGISLAHFGRTIRNWKC
jgi:CobQ-like glutamine amidotransferase family enzyme